MEGKEKENKEIMPSRSILKGDNTVPLAISDRLNRRVSFNPEVTLHKIDIVRYEMEKRRETISSIPVRHSKNVVNDHLSDGSDEDGGNDNDDDQSMELTGDIARVEQHVLEPGSQNAQPEQEADAFQGDITSLMQLTQLYPRLDDAMELTQEVGSIESTNDTRKDTSTNADNNDHNDDDNQMLQTMDITQFASSLQGPLVNEFNGDRPDNMSDTPKDDEEMEFTQDIGKIEKASNIGGLNPAEDYADLNEQKDTAHTADEIPKTIDSTQGEREATIPEYESGSAYHNMMPSADVKTQKSSNSSSDEESEMDDMTFTQVAQTPIFQIGVGSQSLDTFQMKGTAGASIDNQYVDTNDRGSNAVDIENNIHNSFKLNQSPREKEPRSNPSLIRNKDLRLSFFPTEGDVNTQKNQFPKQIHGESDDNAPVSERKSFHNSDITSEGQNIGDRINPQTNGEPTDFKKIEENSVSEKPENMAIEETDIAEGFEERRSDSSRDEEDSFEQRIGSKKRKLALHEAKVIEHQYPKIDNRMIPLAGIKEKSDDDYSSILLSTFLRDIGIRFYDDLEIGHQIESRISLSLTKVDQTCFSFKDYAKATGKLCQLELYDFCCKELSKNIEDGKALFSQFNEVVSENNPKLFKEYYQASPNEQLNLKSGFQLIKDYSRLQAKEVWYNWRIQLLNNLHNLLEEHFDALVKDKELLKKSIEDINKVHTQVRHQHQLLSVQLDHCTKVQSYCKNKNKDDLKKLKQEVTYIRDKFINLKLEYSNKSEKVNQLKLSIDENENLIMTLKDEISNLERLLDSNKKYEFSEIKLLQKRFEELQSKSALKFIKQERLKLYFIYQEKVNVCLNFEDVTKTSNLNICLADCTLRNQSELEPFLFLTLAGLNCTNIVQQFHAFKCYFAVFKKLDKDIYLMNVRYPIRFLQRDDHNLSFELTYLSPSALIKVAIAFDLDMNKIKNYPSNVSVKAVVRRSPHKLEKDEILTQITDSLHHSDLFSFTSPLEIVPN